MYKHKNYLQTAVIAKSKWPREGVVIFEQKCWIILKMKVDEWNV